MHSEKQLNKKILKKFLKLLDNNGDIDTCLAQFKDHAEFKYLNQYVAQYAEIVKTFEKLKNIKISKDLEDNSLKDIYLKLKTENLKNTNKIPKKDKQLIMLRPAYIKPLVIFLSIFIFTSFSFAGTLYASESSIPGDKLYTFKRFSENIQVVFTPFKYEKVLYLKFLDKRLSEAKTILNNSTYNNEKAAEKLFSDLYDTYKKCHDRKYLDTDKEMQIQSKINEIEEGFRHRYGMKKRIYFNLPNQNNAYNNDNSNEDNNEGNNKGNYEGGNKGSHAMLRKQNQFGK